MTSDSTVVPQHKHVDDPLATVLRKRLTVALYVTA
jgi:hypothetical protein